MTQWSGAMVAKWLQAVGFDPDDVVHGVALALATSGGADHYRQNPTTMPHTERRGLYALRGDDVPPEGGWDLYDPEAATQALRATWEANGGRWDWHPAHVAGRVIIFEPMVRVMLGRPRPSEGTIDASDFHGALANMVHLRRAVLQAGK